MSDWTDEVRARMVREEERLRYKAANLQARGKTVMAAQELAVADDIRAALAEVERLREDSLSSAPPYYRHWEEAVKRAEAAEKRVEELERDYAEVQDISVSESVGRRAAEAEVERFRGVVMDFHWLYGFFKDKGMVSPAVKAKLESIAAALRGGGE